jgi:phosphate starvation-inducible protein PhoH and related proteins
MRNRKKKAAPNTPEFRLNYIRPLNENQANVLGSDRNLVLSGYAGTGKTYLASYVAYKEMFEGKYNKLVYMRSAVPTRNIGFLPGNDKEKLEVYEAPYIDIATELLGRGDAYEILKKKGLVHFTSTSFVRGINLRDAVLVVDECQNMSYHELDSIITRLNENCKVIFCGDIRQADLYKNGLQDFYRVLEAMDEFDFIEFQKEDIVRSELVKNYIIKKEEVLNRL